MFHNGVLNVIEKFVLNFPYNSIITPGGYYKIIILRTLKTKFNQYSPVDFFPDFITTRSLDSNNYTKPEQLYNINWSLEDILSI